MSNIFAVGIHHPFPNFSGGGISVNIAAKSADAALKKALPQIKNMVENYCKGPKWKGIVISQDGEVKTYSRKAILKKIKIAAAKKRSGLKPKEK